MDDPTPLSILQLAAADLARATSKYAHGHLEKLHKRSELSILCGDLAQALKDLEEAIAPGDNAPPLERLQAAAGLVGAAHDCLLEIAFSAEALPEEDLRSG
jgi:hypothetical protein